MNEAVKRVRAAIARVSGVPVTPYAVDGSVDEQGVARVVSRMATAGVPAIVGGGNTGEFFALTMAEARAVLEAAALGNAGKAVLIAGVGRTVAEAIELGRVAEAVKYDAIMIHQPNDPFTAPSGSIDYMRRIADAVGLPIVAYVRAPSYRAEHLGKLAADDRFAGVKYAIPDLQGLSACIAATAGTGFAWVCGLAESWAPMFTAAGARGFTSGLVNVWPERSLAISEALDRGDFSKARELIQPIMAFEALRATHGNGANVTAVKEAMAILGDPVGPVRAPGLTKFSASEHNTLRQVVQSWALKR